MSESELALEVPYGRAATSAAASASASVSSPVAVARQAASQLKHSERRLISMPYSALHTKTPSLPFASSAPPPTPSTPSALSVLQPPSFVQMPQSLALSPNSQPTLAAGQLPSALLAQTPSPASATGAQVAGVCAPSTSMSITPSGLGTTATASSAAQPKEKEKALQKGGHRGEPPAPQQSQSQPSKNNLKAKLIRLVRRFKPPGDSVEALDPATASSHAGRTARPRCALLCSAVHQLHDLTS